MTKMERVTGIALLTVVVCTVHAGISTYISERVSAIVTEIAKVLAASG